MIEQEFTWRELTNDAPWIKSINDVPIRHDDAITYALLHALYDVAQPCYDHASLRFIQHLTILTR
jgi:hypothetical protein